jgi:hypothetical protein
VNFEHTSLLISIGLFVVGLAGFYLASSSRYFTIREHQEFMSSIFREFDKIHGQLVRLEDTRPTTGELEARLNRNGLKT